MEKLNKIFKWGMVVLILISVALLVWGSVTGFEANDGKAVEVLLYWAYFMVGLALCSWVLVGLAVGTKNNPKFLVKSGIVVVGLAAIVLVAYLLAPGSELVGSNARATAGELKLTDTVLNLVYFAGVAAVVAIVVGEVRMAVVNKK